MNKKSRKVFIIIFLILIIILVMVSVLLSKVEKKVEEENIVISYEDLKTIKDVVEYHKSVYISESKSSKEDYDIDVKLKFRYDLYEDETSNEEFYNKIINDIAKITNYKSFRLIDEEKEITVEVICIDRAVDIILINGIEDYFIYKDSQISLSKYEEIPDKELNIESPIVAQLINNNWDKNTYFGTRESIYNLYDIYFEEGLSVRNIDGKVYNIIFTTNYNSTIVNGIHPGMDLKSIKSILGTPSFENEELKYIGYKNNDLYVFFTDKEVSIYRRDFKDMTAFLELMDGFLNDEIEFLDLMNYVTYLWPDYSEYDYSTNSIFLSYPLAGVDIKINYDHTTGIIFYNNVNQLDKVKKYLENTEFMGLLQVDNVNLAEERRLKNNLEEDKKLKEYKNKTKYDGYESNLYDCFPEVDELGYNTKMKFVSKYGQVPNREINDTIDSYVWINDIYFVFSKKKKGIYCYDVNSGYIQNLIEGNEEYKIKSFENGILKFDNTEVNIEF